VVLAAAVIALAAPAPSVASGSDSATGVFTGPGPKTFFGFAGVRQFGLPDPATAAARVAAVDGNMTRTAMHWQAMEPARDLLNEAAFDPYERLYDALRARRIKPILMVQFAPAWARDAGPARECGTADRCHYPPARAMLPEWGEFIEEIARRFPDAAIEVWNEPNYLTQWQSGPDPERYAELLATARDAARSINPGMMVIAGGLGMGAKEGWVDPASFLRRGYAASPSLEGNTDALNFHAYPTSAGPTDTWLEDLFDVIRSARNAAGDATTPILVTEFGATTTGLGSLNEDEQAQWLLQGLGKAFAMDDVLGVLVYTLADRNELALTDRERGFGVVRASSGILGSSIEPKLAYCGLIRATTDVAIDTDCPPETEITSGPPRFGADDDAEFTFDSPDLTAVGFECKLDDAPFRGCGSPMSYEGLAAGAHVFQVRALDLFGRVDPYPARSEFAIDSTGRRLVVAVDPPRTKARVGGRRVRFEVAVTNPGAPLHTEGVRICARAKARLVRLHGKRCRSAPDIAPGATAVSRFGYSARPKGAGKTARVRFVASALHTLRGRSAAGIRIR
jgi:hypothetical protein